MFVRKDIHSTYMYLLDTSNLVIYITLYPTSQNYIIASFPTNLCLNFLSNEFVHQAHSNWKQKY